MVGEARNNAFEPHKEIPPQVSVSPFCPWWYIAIDTLSYIRYRCKWNLLLDKCEKTRRLIKKDKQTTQTKTKTTKKSLKTTTTYNPSKHSTGPLKQQHENLLGYWNYVVWELWKTVFWVGRLIYLWEKSEDSNRFREAEIQDCSEMTSQEEDEGF